MGGETEKFHNQLHPVKVLPSKKQVATKELFNQGDEFQGPQKYRDKEVRILVFPF